MRRGALVLAALLTPALPGCAASTASEPAVAAGSSLEVDLAPAGPWSEAKPHFALATTAPRPQPRADSAKAQRPVVAARALPPAPPAPLTPPLPVPAARGTGQAAPKGAPPAKPLEALARERFLDHPTEVRGDSLTLVLPARLLPEARLTGAEVTEPSPGRRVAAGGARLVCRELTLVGERITLRTRTDGSEDVQITARGGVDFVSRRHGHVVREQGLRTLILTNDAITPIP